MQTPSHGRPIKADRQGLKRMTRTNAADNRSPYPTIGECLRFVVGAFDLRGHGDAAARKLLDRLANEGDYDWTLFPEILNQMIRQPLAKCTDEEFATFTATRLGHIRENYISVIGEISLDALSRDEALPALAQHYFIPMASGLLQRTRATFGGPDLNLLLAPPMTTTDGKVDNFNPIEAVLHWFVRAHTGKFGQLPAHLYDDANDPDRTKRDLLSRHLRGKQIPDVAALRDVVKTIRSRPWYSHNGPTPQLLSRWLFIARALIWAETHVPATVNLRAALLRWAAPDVPPEFDVGMPLSTLVAARGTQFLDLAAAGGNAFLHISTRQQLSAKQLTAAVEDVREFRRAFERAGQPQSALYMLHWCEARQAAWEGNRDEALRLYKLAADAALYRSGPEMKKLLLEAVLMAAECRRKVVYNQLMSRAAALHVFTYPLGGPITNIPLMEEICVNFLIYFPHVPPPGQRLS
jgi:hypothetical protein